MRSLVALVLSSLALVACGASRSGDDGPAKAAKASPKLVATATLSQGDSARLFRVPGLGVFRGSCDGPGRGEIGYRASQTASQLVTVTGRDSSSGNLDPGDGFKAAIGIPGWPRLDWQVALFSAGSIRVADASFSIGKLPGGTGCLVVGRAEVTARGR